MSAFNPYEFKGLDGLPEDEKIKALSSEGGQKLADSAAQTLLIGATDPLALSRHTVDPRIDLLARQLNLQDIPRYQSDRYYLLPPGNAVGSDIGMIISKGLADQMDPMELKFLLSHEASHVRRGDEKRTYKYEHDISGNPGQLAVGSGFEPFMWKNIERRADRDAAKNLLMNGIEPDVSTLFNSLANPNPEPNDPINLSPKDDHYGAAQRRDDINNALRDPDLKALIGVLRGGRGAMN